MQIEAHKYSNCVLFLLVSIDVTAVFTCMCRAIGCCKSNARCRRTQLAAFTIFTNMHKFIIQHLEPELGKWSLIEYKHISSFLGGPEKLWITNVKELTKQDELKDYATVIPEGVGTLNLENVCILDPEATQTLTPEEAQSIDYFLFGGILGGYPPKKRTEKELTQFMPKDYIVRNIGTYQMPTDSAVFTVNEIAKGRKFEQIEFKDRPEFNISQYEVIQIPMRYAVVNGKPLVSPDLLEHWRTSEDDWIFGSDNAPQNDDDNESEEEDDDDQE